MSTQIKKVSSLTEAIASIVTAVGERTPLKAFDKVKKTSVAAQCREAGITIGELAESLGYGDASSFLKQQLNVDTKTLRLEELWTSDELHGMQPELFLDTILMANLNAMVTHNFVTEIPINRGEIVVRTFEDGGQVYEVGQGETIRDDQGVIIRRTVFIKKIGRGLNWSYEEERRTQFPLIQINLMRIGLRMALKKDLDVLNVLRTGIPAQLSNGSQPAQAAIPTPVSVSQSNTAGSGVPAGQLVFADIVQIVTDIANRNYHGDFAVMSPVTYGKFALIPQVSNYLNAGPMASKVLETGVISHFFGLDLFITKQMPDNEILAGQKGFAGAIFVEQPLLLEEEKIISKQIERCQVTECYGPMVLYTQALTRLPF
jgi:hypothetical protein